MAKTSRKTNSTNRSRTIIAVLALLLVLSVAGVNVVELLVMACSLVLFGGFIRRQLRTGFRK